MPNLMKTIIFYHRLGITLYTYHQNPKQITKCEKGMKFLPETTLFPPRSRLNRYPWCRRSSDRYQQSDDESHHHWRTEAWRIQAPETPRPPRATWPPARFSPDAAPDAASMAGDAGGGREGDEAERRSWWEWSCGGAEEGN